MGNVRSARLVLAPLIALVYLSLPRAAFAVFVPHSPLQFTIGYLNLNVAYVTVILALFHAANTAMPSTWTRWPVLIWLHAEFFLRSVEGSVEMKTGVGFSRLFFLHLDPTSLGLAWSQGKAALLVIAVVIVVAHHVMGAMLVGARRGRRWEQATALVLLIVGIRSGFVLQHQRSRLAQTDIAGLSFAVNAERYYDHPPATSKVSLTEREQRVLLNMGLGSAASARPVPPTSPRHFNVILVYLEGFQTNFTALGGSRHPGLTPTLDRLGQRFSFAPDYYNAVTPTINAIVSSQCGLIVDLQNDSFGVDHGFLRDVTCLSDVLHDAGYYQVFMGGANAGFSGKRAFLEAHHFDEVWGWEQWSRRTRTAHSGYEWGLHDTDLLDEALSRVEALESSGPPFQLSVLTLNTHPPGYLAPSCKSYQADAPMLNAIHCTDQALGTFFAGLEARGILDNTVVMIMGDHVTFPTVENQAALGADVVTGWFGRTLMMFHAPGRPDARINEVAYTPDVAPTVLALAGLNSMPVFDLGRSLLDPHLDRRTLVSLRFSIVNGQMIPANPDLTEGCPADEIPRTVVDSSTNPSDCARLRILMALEGPDLMLQ